MKVIQSATYKKYNANNSGNSSPDCVKRAISMAFDVPYVKVGQYLNKLMHEKHRSAWNIPSVYEPYIRELGGSAPYKPEGDLTVEEFADQNPSGTFVLETGPKPKTPMHCGNHLTCVIDNVLYDSWNSSNQYVVTVYRCSTSRHIEFSDIQDHWKELAAYAREQVTDLVSKHMDKNPDFHADDVDELEFEILSTSASGYTMYQNCQFYVGTKDMICALSYKFKLAYVFTPETTVEEAKKKIDETAKVRIYDRFYTINKMWKEKRKEAEIEKEMKAQGQSVYNPRFLDAREHKFYNSLPAQIRARVTRLSIYYPGEYYYSYQLDFKPVPGDPKSAEVRLEGYTADEIRKEIDLYLNEGYQRLYDDYSIDDI